MGIHLRPLLIFAGFILVLQLCLTVEARPKENGDGDGGDDDDDSSSEETVEDSEEAQRRRRDAGANNSMGERAGIPGLPDPATIIKIAQLFQSVGEQIVPILLEAVLPGSDPAGVRSVRDLPLLKNLRRTFEMYSDELQLNDN
ncbi:antennal-specific protein OS-C [Drosophila grimshawi]|uniref:GH17643 n=1 Tax=Drosophila grimshawi TaxID=7222 RepID=B4JSR4_DROGR|nr:antennal-specific protein OS-C [Drosophila grimshawi]EDV94804.1 GH17643 [Drosophila grimshawi]